MIDARLGSHRYLPIALASTCLLFRESRIYTEVALVPLR